MTTWIALLRGINVGGHRKVPMADLRALVEGLGYSDVSTYIQSGNLVFAADGGEADIAAALESAIEARFGFAVPVIVRSAEEFAMVAGAHPLADGGTDAGLLMVAFLDRAPVATPQDVIDEDAFLPDRLLQVGRQIYLEYPNGSGRSKLNAALLERRLGVRATVRNWKTVQALVASADAAQG